MHWAAACSACALVAWLVAAAVAPARLGTDVVGAAEHPATTSRPLRTRMLLRFIGFLSPGGDRHSDSGPAVTAAQQRTVLRREGVRALTMAEQIAPQLVRNNVFVREAVSDLVQRARRDAGGRDLRGLAYRMGVAPIG